MEISKKDIKKGKERQFPNKICFKPIGIIHSEFKSLKDIPIQYALSTSKGILEIFQEFVDALKDLDGFSHIICLYFFDMINLPVPLQSKPFLENKIHGIFSIRTPFRPNPIGFSIFEILNIRRNEIHVNNIDVIDKTPLLDIKPYVPQFDSVKTDKIGWLKNKIPAN